ncbi:MAG: periplasmic divalent cation tolerance protein [Gammaproteobacteria bacterium]|jgi:periplasmic divalent cation tolerance protein
MSQSHVVALVTCPVELAEGFAQKLVQNQLAACINIVPRIVGVYRWKGAVEKDDEALLIIKTSLSRIDEIQPMPG